MEKQYNNEPFSAEELERPVEQLDFNHMDGETRELLERDRLPTPTELEKYNELMPNGADRILNIIEEEKMHRREVELKEIKNRGDFNNLRVIFGFLFGFFFLIFVNVDGGGVSYMLVWAAMVVVLVMIFAPYIKSKLSEKK